MLNPLEAIQKAYLNYKNVNGRASRSEFWWFHLYSWMLAHIAGFLIAQTLLTDESQLFILFSTTLFALAIPGLTVAIRRLHDTNRSAWWLLLGFIPVIGTLALIYFWVGKSDLSKNQFGEPPYEINENLDGSGATV